MMQKDNERYLVMRGENEIKRGGAERMKTIQMDGEREREREHG